MCDRNILRGVWSVAHMYALTVFTVYATTTIKKYKNEKQLPARYVVEN